MPDSRAILLTTTPYCLQATWIYNHLGIDLMPFPSSGRGLDKRTGTQQIQREKCDVPAHQSQGQGRRTVSRGSPFTSLSGRCHPRSCTSEHNASSFRRLPQVLASKQEVGQPLDKDRSTASRFYLFMRDTGKETETQEEGEAGSPQGAGCGTPSWTPGSRPEPKHPGCCRINGAIPYGSSASLAPASWRISLPRPNVCSSSLDHCSYMTMLSSARGSCIISEARSTGPLLCWSHLDKLSFSPYKGNLLQTGNEAETQRFQLYSEETAASSLSDSEGLSTTQMVSMDLLESCVFF
ncbi:uncharacterized protein LOC144313017 isoform X1 [Canis aureus]